MASVLEVFAQLDCQPRNGASASSLHKELRDAGCWQEGHRDAHEVLTELWRLIPVLSRGFLFTIGSHILHRGKVVSDHRQNEAQELILPIDQSVQHSLRAFFTDEEVEFKVNQINKACTLRRFIESLPDVLFIGLQRFDATNKKDDSAMTIDLMLDVAGTSYILFGTVLHSGTVNSGHYKVLVNEELKMNWTLYDDEKATTVIGEQVLNQISRGELTAYLVFYIKQARASNMLTSSAGRNCRTNRKRKQRDYDSSSEEYSNATAGTCKRRKSFKSSQSSFDEEQIEDCASEEIELEDEELINQGVQDNETLAADGPSAEEIVKATLLNANRKIDKPKFRRVFRFRVVDDAYEWLIEWSFQKTSYLNWVKQRQFSLSLQKLLRNFQLSNSDPAFGWIDHTKQIKAPETTTWEFDDSKCGPVSPPPDTSPKSLFELFFPPELQLQIVDDINRFAVLDFDAKQLERTAIRNKRVDRFKAWAKEKEQEYPDLVSSDTWKSNLKDLDDSMAFSYTFNEKDRQKHNKMQQNWKDVSLEEFQTFVGIVLAIRCVAGKRFDDYFNEKDPKYGNEWIAMHISRARFRQILNNFHYNVDLVLAKVAKHCQEHWNPHQRVTFDETIMPFLGMFYGLPHPNGVLLHMLADSRHFIWDFDFFLGLILPPKYQILDIVKKMPQKHHILTTDSKWGSEELARVLDERQCLYLLSCKKSSPSYIFDNLHDQAKEIGQSSAMYSKTDQSTIAACSFHDTNATMNLISNYVSDKFNWYKLGLKVVPPSPGAKRTLGKPLCNQEYIYSKGFVDEAARQLHTYDWPHKTKKWTVAMFHTLMTICTWNAFVYRKSLLIQDNNKKMKDFRNFLSTLANQLAEVRLRDTRHPSRLVRVRDKDKIIVIKKYTPSVEVSHLHVAVPHSSIQHLGARQLWCQFCPKRKRQKASRSCLACSLATGKPVPVCKTCMLKHRTRLGCSYLF